MRLYVKNILIFKRNIQVFYIKFGFATQPIQLYFSDYCELSVTVQAPNFQTVGIANRFILGKLCIFTHHFASSVYAEAGRIQYFGDICLQFRLAEFILSLERYWYKLFILRHNLTLSIVQNQFGKSGDTKVKKCSFGHFIFVYLCL